jgi:beta-glucanase (GH16 family)
MRLGLFIFLVIASLSDVIVYAAELLVQETFADLDQWNFNNGAVYNHEQEHYTSRNTHLRGNCDGLAIEAREDFSSARLTSKWGWMHGYMEVRAKLPSGPGMWPAIWLLPKEGQWPFGGEIDLVEARGNQICGTVHFAQDGQHRWFGNCRDYEPGYHVYGLEWHSDEINMFVDGALLMRVTPDDIGSWPFNAPFYVILNVAIGGDFVGHVDTVTSEDMLVDYINVWSA